MPPTPVPHSERFRSSDDPSHGGEKEIISLDVGWGEVFEARVLLRYDPFFLRLTVILIRVDVEADFVE